MNNNSSTASLSLYALASVICGLILPVQGNRANAHEMCDPSSVTTYKYLMTFHVCSGEQCNDPRYHMVYLAGSDDGLNWSLIEGFEPFSGSVPDIVFYNNSLYIFHTGMPSQWHKLNECFEVVEEGNVLLEGSDHYSFVDPSMIVDDGKLFLVYLPGVGMGNPAGCNSYPCTKEIHSAVAADDSISTFFQNNGYLATMYIESHESEIQLFCDPDIIKLHNGTYLLYVSTGPNTVVYQSATFPDIFVSPDEPNVVIISSAGGVPSAIQAPDGSVWLYVNGYIHELGGVILRGVSKDGITPIDSEDFEVAISREILDEFSDDTLVSSPSIIEWPIWVSTTSTTSTITSTTTTTSTPATTTSASPQLCLAESLYGETSEKTEILRYVRDSILNNTNEGKAIITLYYELSPSLVKIIAEDKELMEAIKFLVDEIILLLL